jgi:hypothetical protein
LSAGIGEPAGGNHRNLDTVGRGGDQDQSGNVVFARMSGAFEPVDADAVHTKLLRLHRVPNRGALVQHVVSAGALVANF